MHISHPVYILKILGFCFSYFGHYRLSVVTEGWHWPWHLVYSQGVRISARRHLQIWGTKRSRCLYPLNSTLAVLRHIFSILSTTRKITCGNGHYRGSWIRVITQNHPIPPHNTPYHPIPPHTTLYHPYTIPIPSPYHPHTIPIPPKVSPYHPHTTPYHPIPFPYHSHTIPHIYSDVRLHRYTSILCYEIISES